MSTLVVTSMSTKNLSEYGERFLRSYLDHWPYTLAVYSEDITEDDVPEYARQFLLRQLTPAMSKAFWDQMSRYTGRTKVGGYNYRFDANKFCRKVVAIWDAWKRGPSVRYLVWLDADVVTHADIPEDFTREMLDGKRFAYLGREHLGIHAEGAFYAWDLSAPETPRFMNTFMNVFVTGAFRWLSEWHDCHAAEIARNLSGIPTRNLSEDIRTAHVFVESPLGAYMDHLKGPSRKKMGYSPEHPANAGRPQVRLPGA